MFLIEKVVSLLYLVDCFYRYTLFCVSSFSCWWPLTRCWWRRLRRYFTSWWRIIRRCLVSTWRVCSFSCWCTLGPTCFQLPSFSNTRISSRLSAQMRWVTLTYAEICRNTTFNFVVFVDILPVAAAFFRIVPKKAAAVVKTSTKTIKLKAIIWWILCIITHRFNLWACSKWLPTVLQWFSYTVSAQK